MTSCVLLWLIPSTFHIKYARLMAFISVYNRPDSITRQIVSRPGSKLQLFYLAALDECLVPQVVAVCLHLVTSLSLHILTR